MTVADIETSTLTARHDALAGRLGAFRRQVVRRLLLSGSARVFAELALAAVLSLLIDRWLRLSLPLRVILLFLAACGLAREIYRHIVQPLRIPTNLVGLAAAIDRARGNRNGNSLAPRVATVLELPGLLSRPAPPSQAMVERAVHAADESLRGIEFESTLDDRRHKLNLYGILAIALVSLLLIVMNPGTVGLWARRWFTGSREPWPQSTYLQIVGLGSDGKIIVPRGEPYTLRLTTIHSSVIPDAISLRIREGKGSRTSAAMSKFAANDFRYDLPPVEVPVTIEAEGGDDEAVPFIVEPVDRPRITSLALTSQHPSDKAPQHHDFTGQDADLSFLPKTKLELQFAANVPIASVKVGGAPGEVRQLSDNRFAVSWTHEKSVAMQIELMSDQAKLSSLPTQVAIGLKVDQPPRVSLAFSGVRQRITPMAKIPLNVQARDDYGVSQVDLNAKADFLDADKKPQTLNSSKNLFGPTHPAVDQEIEQKPTFDVTGLKLSPGAILALTGSATDERYESPQVGLSRPATFRIVAPEELFREILLKQQGERAKFRKQIDECNSLKEALAAITDSQAAAQIARRHRNVQREVARIGTSLSESILEMRLNGLGTTQAYDLMQKNVIGPLKQMDTDLMIPQRDAMDALTGQSKVEEVLGREDQIINKMQEILKQMSQWDSFVDVINQLNEIIRMQEAVKVGTDGLKTKQTNDVFDK